MRFDMVIHSNMSKHLITSGCSFSEVKPNQTETWPTHLANLMTEFKPVHTGMSSQGNGIISRKVIYEVQAKIQASVRPADIFVGIMWSSPGRYDIFSDSSPPGYDDSSNEELKIYENPTKFVRENENKQWYVFNHNWQKTYFNSTYYKLYHNEVMHSILTIEHVLRIQWYLKSLGINYFMTSYTNKVFPSNLISHPEIQYLYNQIDFSQFLPVEGEYEWCRDCSEYEFPDKHDMHPGSMQHMDFTNKVIYPWLVSKGYMK